MGTRSGPAGPYGRREAKPARKGPARKGHAARCILAALLALPLLWGVAGRALGAEPPLPLALPGAEMAPVARAFDAAARGNWERAHRLAREAGNPLSARLLRWWDYSSEGTRASFAAIARFIDENPDWPSRRALQAAAEAAMAGAGVSDAAVLAWYRVRDPVSRAGRLRYADALLGAGEKARAAKFVRAAWVEDSFGARELADTLRRYRSLLRPADHRARLDRLLWDGRNRAARRMFRHVDAGQRRLAEARLALRARAGGVDAAIARVPRALRGEAGLVYERLRWRREKGMDESARALLRAPLERLGPRPKLWWRERAILARRALEDGLVSEAYALAAGHRQIATSTFAEAEWLAGWLALRFLREPERALRHFSRLHDAVSMPVSRARAAYWAGRAAEALGDADGARLWHGDAADHPGTFYGQLSAARIAAPDAPLLRESAAVGAATLEGHALFAAARLLSSLGYERLLEPFIDRLGALARNRADHDLISAFCLSIGRPDHAIRAAQQAARKGYASVERLFPLVALPFSRRDAALEPALVLALVRQESRFDKAAHSRAGALGLMQLMPGTARAVARRMRLDYARRRLTSDPAYSMALGSRYLGSLLEKYGGSYLLAVAAYNGGPGNVGRWLAANGDPRRDPGVDIVDWIETIPFSETRNYVQRVLEGTQVYRWRLGRRPSVSSLERDLARGMARPVLAARCARPAGAGPLERADLRALC